MKFFLTILSLSLFRTSHAQNVNRIISNGNDAYKRGAYKDAAELYKKALTKDEKNSIAKFNLGNALQKQNDAVNAEKYYDEVASAVSDASLKAKAFYNKGVAEVRQQKLPDAIESFKQALKIIPEDNDTRENLQKAINDLKKQQQSQSQQRPKNQKQRQEKQKNKLTNQETIEQKFSELRDKEKQLQKALQRKPNAAQPEKDW